MMNSHCNCGWGGCTTSKVSKILLIIGGLNWGLIGIGILLNSDWNIVYKLLGAWPMLEAIVYVLVGAAAVVKLVGCKCKKCAEACGNCTCASVVNSSDVKTEGKV